MSINQQHLEQFCTVLSSLMSPDNSVRKAAETQLTSIPADNRAQLLLHVLTVQATVALKNVACVTLKMLFLDVPSRSEISEHTFAFSKQCIPQLVVSEENPSYRKKLISLMSSLIEIFCRDGTNTWEDSITFLLNCVGSNEPKMQEIALNLVICNPTMFGDRMKQIFPQYVQFISKCLQSHQTNPKLSVLSIEALGMIAEVNADKPSVEILSQLVPYLLVAIKCLTLTPEGSLCMSHVTNLLEYNTRMFKNYVVQVVEVLIGMLSVAAIEKQVTYDVFESLVSYVQKVPGAIKKSCAKHIPLIINYAYNMLTEIDDEQLAEWLTQFDEYAEDNLSESAYFGETSLDRISCAIKGEVMLPLALQKVTDFLQNQDWRYQDAALVSLGAIAEGCRKQMKPVLPQIVKTIAPFFESPNPKIVFSAINTIGQLSSDYPGYFHNHYHSQVFPLIFKVAESHNYIKIQSQAVFAFVNVVDGCSEKLLEIYAPTMCQLLVNISSRISHSMNVRGINLLTRAVTNAIVHICDRMGPKFEPYGPNLIQNLFAILDKIAFEHTNNVIINQVLDCLVRIVSSFQSEAAVQCYVPSILKYVELFSTLGEKSPDPVEIQLCYYSLLSKLADIGPNCLTSILPKLLPSLLSFLSNRNGNNGIDSRSTTAIRNSLDSDGDFDFEGYNDDYINDKCVVCDLISSLAENLKGSFSQYVEPCLQVLLVIFSKHSGDSIRSYLTNCIPPLLNCLVLNGNLAYALTLWNSSIKNVLLLSIKDDPNEEILGDLLENFTRCVTFLGSESLSLAEIKYLGEVFNSKIVSLIQYDDELSQAKKIKCDDEDDEILDECDVEQYYINDIILQSLQSCTHDLFSVFKEVFLTAVEHMYKTLLMCLDQKRSDMYIRFSFCIFDDVVEFAPQSAPNIYVDFMPKMLHYLSSENPDLRQVTAFGFGLVAQSQVSTCYNFLSSSIPLLVKHISHSSANTPDNITATANCIAAYGRYIRFVPQLFSDPAQELKNWLQLLPVLDDEVDFCLGYLCELIDTQPNNIFLNNNDQHNTKILHAVIIMLLECFDDGVCKKAVATIVTLQNVFPSLIAQCISTLDDSEKSYFDRLIKGDP